MLVLFNFDFYTTLWFRTYNILFQKISRLEKDNSKLLEEKEKLQKTKESILHKFNNIGCYPSIRICSCGIRLKSGQDVSATETRGSGERDNGVTQQKLP